jgi:hypothetical protein
MDKESFVRLPDLTVTLFSPNEVTLIINSFPGQQFFQIDNAFDTQSDLLFLVLNFPASFLDFSYWILIMFDFISWLAQKTNE